MSNSFVSRSRLATSREATLAFSALAARSDIGMDDGLSFGPFETLSESFSDPIDLVLDRSGEDFNNKRLDIRGRAIYLPYPLGVSLQLQFVPPLEIQTYSLYAVVIMLIFLFSPVLVSLPLISQMRNLVFFL